MGRQKGSTANGGSPDDLTVSFEFQIFCQDIQGNEIPDTDETVFDHDNDTAYLTTGFFKDAIENFTIEEVTILDPGGEGIVYELPAPIDIPIASFKAEVITEGNDTYIEYTITDEFGNPIDVASQIDYPSMTDQQYQNINLKATTFKLMILENGNYANGLTAQNVNNFILQATNSIDYIIENQVLSMALPYGFETSPLNILDIDPALSRIEGNNRNNYLKGTNDDDDMFGLIGNDTLFGLDGDDYLNGGIGVDSLLGGKGDDTISGESGNDYLQGDNGNDSLLGGYGDDTLNGGNKNFLRGSDNDYLQGDNGNDSLLGGFGHDTLDGGFHNDNLNGNAGNDLLIGGNGEDTLKGYGGGVEYDTLIGGIGADEFVLGAMGNQRNSTYYQGLGHATITDYDHLEDIIRVSGNVTDYTLSLNIITGDTSIRYNGDLIAVVENSTNVSLTGTNTLMGFWSLN